MTTPTSAIIMMLQGHFIHALLGNAYRDNTIYDIWKYFRGMTAPTFFTITGFVFTFLLLKQDTIGIQNPRVLIGVKRALKVIFWGYFLRLSLYAVFKGTLNPSFFYVDVLQCIGTSLLLLIGMYLLFCRKNFKLFQNVTLCIGVAIFLFQPIYGTYILDFLPRTIANYFTNENGSIFTLFPWFGYVCFGSFFAVLFVKNQKQKSFLWHTSIFLFSIGLLLVFCSSDILMALYKFTDVSMFKMVAYNNFLFIRLGNVCVLFSIFIFAKDYLTNPIFTKIGSKTLSIYILHFFILYGSWLGFGLNRFFHHSLTPFYATLGALLFVIGICWLVLYYDKDHWLKQKYSLLLERWKYTILNVAIPDFVATIKRVIVRTYKSVLYIKSR